MEDFYAIPEDELRYTARFLRKEMRERGWGEASAVRTAKNILIFATRPDGKKIRFCSCIPGETTSFAAKLADDKLATCVLFEQEGIPQPETVYLSRDEQKARERLMQLLEKHPKIVVKPVDGAHGRGVVTNIENVETAMDVVASYDSGAIAQEQLQDGITEVRAICIGGKFIAAYKRIPATVTGDGEHNIIELIAKENREVRVEAYQGDLAKIDVDAAERYLREKKIDISRIPEAGEKVRVMAMCNVGMGGTVEETIFDPEQIALAEKIAKVAELPAVGIDFYGDKVIEMNAGPMLYYPTGDESATKCVKAYADYLEKI